MPDDWKERGGVSGFGVCERCGTTLTECLKGTLCCEKCVFPVVES